MNALTKKTLKALLWKDFRQQKRFLIYGTLIIAFPYLFSWVHAMVVQDSPEKSMSAWVVEDGLPMSLCFSYWVAAIVIVMVASDLEDEKNRSACFMAQLPPSNAAILASKTIFLAVPCLVWLGIPIALIKLFGLAPLEQSPFDAFIVLDCVTLIALAVFVFGAFWLVGLLMKLGWLAKICAYAMLTIFFSSIYVPVFSDFDMEIVKQWIAIVALPAGLICYGLGWWFGLRARRLPA